MPVAAAGRRLAILQYLLPQIPLYTHLRMSSTQPVRRMATPPLARATRLRRAAAARAPKTHFHGDKS